MAYTAHNDPEQVKEIEDNEEVFKKKATEIVKLIKSSKYIIFFTGAGISTAAGIPDFRGPNGVWTLKAQGKVAKSRVTSIKAVPTRTHMAIVELMKNGFVKYLISQNTDGLHRKSGVPLDKFAELHGNQTLEKCHTPNCGKEYIRDYRTRTAISTHDHITGRKCGKCNGDLYDSIINFDESLPKKELENGFSESEKADLCIVLGSSLTVTPAADIPETVAKNGYNLVICNLQKTPLDYLAKCKINSTTDKLMEFIMQELNISIPKWLLRRYITVSCKKNKDDRVLRVGSVDSDGIEASIIDKAKIVLPFNFLTLETSLNKEPFKFDIIRLHDINNLSLDEIMEWKNRKLNLLINKANISKSGVIEKRDLAELLLKNIDKLPKEASITLTFMGHYNEPDFTFSVSLDGGFEILIILDYDVTTRVWTVVERNSK